MMKARQTGFTLVELMVTVLVLVIVLAFAFPQFQRLSAQNRTAAAVNDLISALQFARSQAVTRAVPVSVCAKKATADTCDTSAQYDWDNGWLVFEDPDGDGSLDTGETVLRIGKVDARADLTASASSLTFLASGAASAARNIQVDIASDTEDHQVRCARVGPSGQIRKTNSACS